MVDKGGTRYALTRVMVLIKTAMMFSHLRRQRWGVLTTREMPGIGRIPSRSCPCTSAAIPPISAHHPAGQDCGRFPSQEQVSRKG